MAVGLMALMVSTSANADFLRVDRCSYQVDSMFKPTLTARYQGQKYEFTFGENGLTPGIGFTSRKAILWVKTQIGAQGASGLYTVCGREDPRLDFNRDDR